ncbi:MAG: SDR family oxidoreductase [Rhodothermales bacterium]|nr:SDR family oxidoreductase [Rhodothermales bacterium]
MQAFTDKTVLVTGASSGIGAAMARQLAARGARLLLTARSEDKLRRLADELKDPHGAEAHVFPHDLAEPGAARALYGRVADAGYAIDVLVNNAGYGKIGAFADYGAETYADMIGLNVTNLVALTRLAVPGMIERGSGGILNVASTAAFQPAPHFAVYAATKAFVKSFSEALHAEVARQGVHVTCLCPGPTDTAFHDRSGADPDERYLLYSQSAEAVARVGLEALLKNERLAVSGLLNKVQAAAAWATPTALALPLVEAVMKRS